MKKKSIKTLKKLTGSVRFWFNKSEQNQKNPKKTEPNRFEPVFVLKN